MYSQCVRQSPKFIHKKEAIATLRNIHRTRTQWGIQCITDAWRSLLSATCLLWVLNQNCWYCGLTRFVIHYDCLNKQGFNLLVRLVQLGDGSIHLPINPGFARYFCRAICVTSGILVFFCYCWIIEDCICIWCLRKSSCGWSGSMTGQWSICYCQTVNVMRKYWHENYCGCLSVFGPMLWQRLRSQPQEVHVVLSCSQQIQWSYSTWW